jgi:heme exporter protein D
MSGEADSWSFKKFFMGFFSMKNYAKALVLGFCMTVILVIAFCVITTIASRFKKVTPTQAVGTNQGIVATKNEDKSGNTYSLFNLLNWK